MRKSLFTALVVVLGSGLAAATTASAAPHAAAPAAAETSFTCVHFQDPTVELVWSHVCHF